MGLGPREASRPLFFSILVVFLDTFLCAKASLPGVISSSISASPPTAPASP